MTTAIHSFIQRLSGRWKLIITLNMINWSKNYDSMQIKRWRPAAKNGAHRSSRNNFISIWNDTAWQKILKLKTFSILMKILFWEQSRHLTKPCREHCTLGLNYVKTGLGSGLVVVVAYFPRYQDTGKIQNWWGRTLRIKAPNLLS